MKYLTIFLLDKNPPNLPLKNPNKTAKMHKPSAIFKGIAPNSLIKLVGP